MKNNVLMVFVQEGLRNYEIGRKIGRSEAAVTWVAKAAPVIGTAVTAQRKERL